MPGELDEDRNIVTRQVPEPHGCTFSVELTDLSGLGADNARDMALNWIAEQRCQPIHLLGNDGRPPTRVNIFRISESSAGGTAIAALVTHHALVDELSADLTWAEIFHAASHPEGHSPSGDRYGQWARESMSGSARVRAREMAESLGRHLTSPSLGKLALPGPEREHIARSGATSWFIIPAELANRAEATAGHWSVPAQAIFGAAAARVLGRSATAGRFALFMPMTLRRSPADFTAVGCLTTSLPVLAEPLRGEPAADAAARWHRSVRATMDSADADPGEVERIMRAAMPGWAASPRVSLAFETTTAGNDGPLKWASITQGSGPPKHDLAVFITLDQQYAKQGRITWRPDVISSRYASELGSAILAEVEALCERSPSAPPSLPDSCETG